MTFRPIRFCVCLFVLLGLGASPGFAQEFQDVEGTWIVRITKGDKGAALLEFGTPAAGVFSVTGRGFTLTSSDFFVVAPDQSLVRDSDGRITGTLNLESDNAAALPLGVLTIESGKANAKFEKFNVSGVFTSGVLAPVPIKLKGTRAPETQPVLTGRSTAGKVSGGGTKSKFYDITVTQDAAGFPIFEYVGTGPIAVDKIELPDVPMAGRFILDDKQRLYGTFESAPLGGTGVAEGKLAAKTKASGVSDPRLKLKAEVPARKVKVNATLDRAVSPLLGVAPTGTVDFGAVQLLGSAEQVFTVRNDGVGVLVGEATFVAGGDADFTLLDGTGALVESVSYTVPAETSTTVRVRFSPAESGSRSASLSFSGGGGATRALTGTGADLMVVPAEFLAFPETEVGMTEDLDFTVTNAGSAAITGEAIVTAGTDDFTLREGGEDQTTVAYSLNPGQSTTVTVRFAPADAGTFAGSISFSGGTGAIRGVTGTAVAAP
ncbi:MAG: choice-of-anchor D domain-containing protein [Myxococcota bacterium]